MDTLNARMADTDIRFDDTTQQLEKLRVKILYEQSWAAQFSGIAVAVLYVYLFRHKATPHFLEIWAAMFLLVTAGRLFLIQYFTRHYIKIGHDFDAKKWENIFILLTLVAGSLWGIAVCAAFPVGDLSADSLMGYILAGITAGAAVAYSTSLKSTYCFFLPSILPFAIRLALKGDETYWGMALMILAYSVLFLKLTHKFNRYAIKSIVLSFQKDQLIDRIRLMQSQVTLTAQMSALSQMAGGIAHEINNPLGIAVLSIEFVESFFKEKGNIKLDGESAKFFANIKAAMSRMEKVVKELQFFARRPNDEKFETISLARIIESASNFCQERLKKREISFAVEGLSKDLMIECRPFHLSQVILNLLNNSFEAIHDKKEKWIRLEVIDMGEKIEIAVTDSGNGIAEDIRLKIMQPFFTTKEVGKGMGLGLSVAKGIMENHQGELWLDGGSPNTRFVISLPKIKRLPLQSA